MKNLALGSRIRGKLLALSAFVAWLHCSGATFIVSTTANSGAGSLRQAITDANATSGSNTIVFQIAGSGVHTINLSSTLPAITTPMVIDGTTQPGYSSQPLIELNGASAGTSSGLRLLGGQATVRALVINNFEADGIYIEGYGTNVLEGNWIGINSAGTARKGNHQEGVFIYGSWSNVVGGVGSGRGNVISGNADAGVYVLNGGGNVVQGNRIGTSKNGTAALGNTNNGVAVYNSKWNLVGGAGTGMGNVISANGGSGVYVYGSGAVSNSVQGNCIGTDATGLVGLANAGDGITVQEAGANSIGGTNAGEGNLLSGNAKAGLYLKGAGAVGNVVQGNYIGTDITGKVGLSNGLAGVTLLGASLNLVGGDVPAARNLISGNRQEGVLLTTNSHGNWVQGNYIGVDVTGFKSLSNAFNGVRIESGTNWIGGAVSGAGNVISGNGFNGVFVVGTAASGNWVQGNRIGTAPGGTNALANGLAGVGIAGAGANTVGGATSLAGNVISGNGDAGIYLIGSGANGNVVQGNTIGADATGTKSLGNFYEGIYMQDAPSNTIGGVVVGAGNLISGNRTRGIWLTNASWNVIAGNFIGTGKDGVSALGNVFHAVECEAGANNNRIGGWAGEGNRIGYSQTVYAGVRIRDRSTINTIVGNAIFSNGGLGIDLGTAGVTANDTGDADGGANLQQNFPVLTQAVGGGTVGIRGTLNSWPNSVYVVDFYANPACDGSGYGEGESYLGRSTVTTGADGNGSFVVTLAKAVPAGYAVTATATDAAGNTSEFSACQTVVSAPSLSVTPETNHQLKISWPTTATGFALKQTDDLTPPVHWVTVTNNPVVANGQFVVTIPANGGRSFYRLNFE